MKTVLTEKVVVSDFTASEAYEILYKHVKMKRHIK